ncbi:hypothetical protein D9M68_574460 [compost metagenome]
MMYIPIIAVATQIVLSAQRAAAEPRIADQFVDAEGDRQIIDLAPEDVREVPPRPQLENEA